MNPSFTMARVPAARMGSATRLGSKPIVPTMPTRILFSHPTGNANVRAALAGLHQAGMLAEFHTTIASYPGNIWNRLGKMRWAGEFQRRSFAEELRSITIQHPYRELGRMIASRARLNQLTRHETGRLCIDAVYREIDQQVARRVRQAPKRYDGVYTYEDGGLETMKAAREFGITCIYDLPIAYWQTLRSLLTEEAERLPAWKETLRGGICDSEAKLERKTQEFALANTVVCASQFVARSLPENACSQKKLVVTAFGSPPCGPARGSASFQTGRKLRVLFAGSMSQRKGLGDLFAAVRMLNRSDVELVVMGSPQAPMEFYRNAFDGFTYELGRPHTKVLELMRTCDVFCLPSIVEGRALVMQEAMSQGLPLIITPNTGGEDLIDEGVTGFLVPIRRADKIAEKIAWLADHRVALPDMSRAAQAKASQLTWEAYGKAVADAIREGGGF
jgi:glycosyltransferase involved in cell wall biosynthesis